MGKEGRGAEEGTFAELMKTCGETGGFRDFGDLLERWKMLKELKRMNCEEEAGQLIGGWLHLAPLSRLKAMDATSPSSK